jgi:hypothetical protein
MPCHEFDKDYGQATMNKKKNHVCQSVVENPKLLMGCHPCPPTRLQLESNCAICNNKSIRRDCQSPKCQNHPSIPQNSAIDCLLSGCQKATKVSSLLLESSKSIGRRGSHHYRRWICNVQALIKKHETILILVEESDELVCSETRVNYTWTKTKPSKLFLKNLKNLKNWWKKNKNW